MEHSLGKTIAALRKEKGFTQVELAEKLNVSDKSVSKWESEAGNPDITLLPVIANLFEVTIDFLLTGKQIETISLDDMDDKKRLDYIIKHDDVNKFQKYKYDYQEKYFDRNWYITGTGVHTLNKSFWQPIFERKAYNIFKLCFGKVLEEIKKEEAKNHRYSNNMSQGLNFFEIIPEENRSQFIDFSLEEDNVNWLQALILKHAASTGNSRSATILDLKGMLTQNMVDKFFEKKKVAPKCFEYITNINQEDAGFKIRESYIDRELILACLKYKEQDMFDRYMKLFRTEIEHLGYDKSYVGNVSNTYIYSSGYNSRAVGRCIIIPKEIIEYALSTGQEDQAEKLLSYNKDASKEVFIKYGINVNAYVLTADELKTKKIELDGNSSDIAKQKRIIESEVVLDICKLEALWNDSMTDSTYSFIRKQLETKPITYFEYVIKLTASENWKKLFVFTVDYNFDNANKLMISKKYLEASKSIISNMKQAIDYPNHYSPEIKKLCDINSKYVKYELIIAGNPRELNREPFLKDNAIDYGKSFEEILKIYIDRYKEYWLNKRAEELDRYKLVEKMNHISDEITREYIDAELKKGNVELVIIKLCTKLQAILSKRFNRDDDLFELLNDYCEKDLHWVQDDGWGYDEHCSDDRQIEVLNKLRMQRNNIAHPDKGVEPMTADELQQSIEYVFKIREDKK